MQKIHIVCDSSAAKNTENQLNFNAAGDWEKQKQVVFTTSTNHWDTILTISDNSTIRFV